MLNLKLIAFTKDGAPEIFKFSFGETCWHTVYTTSIFSMKVAKTLPYKFTLAFIQTTAFQGNLPKKADLKEITACIQIL